MNIPKIIQNKSMFTIIINSIKYNPNTIPIAVTNFLKSILRSAQIFFNLPHKFSINVFIQFN